MYKKKALNFHYEKVSRDMRHAEAVKARESSRFKRLSTLRSINDSDFKENSMESSKENKAPECKKPSRLEMLFKWKQEKQIKKEIEKMTKRKPFYTGGNKNVVENMSFKSSFNAQSNSSSFNSSKFVKSKLITPNVAVQPSRILNGKQGTPGATIQSKIPNSKQGIPSSTFPSSRIPNSKQGVSTVTSQLSKIAISKQNSLPKSGTSVSRSNNAAALPRKNPLSTNSSSVVKTGSSLSRSNSTATTARKFPISSAINKDSNKAVPLKAGNNTKKEPFVNRIPNNVPSSANAIKTNISRPVYKGPSEAKFAAKRQEEKPVKKFGTGLSKLTSNVAAVVKGIPVQNKLPVSNVNKKLNPKDTSQPTENISLRKGYCFKTAIAKSTQYRTDTLLKTPMHGTPKKILGKTLKNIEEKASTKELAEQSVDCIPDITFNSDISMIKPVRTSFAPVNFTFQPPEGLNFLFDDDDCDIYQTLEEIKQKFMSRTSTPSKDSGRKSSIKSSKESDISNSSDIHISELMTPVSIKIKTDVGETDKTATKQTCNEVVCDLITNTEIKEADICVNQQACDEVAATVSPIKTLFKETDVIANQDNEELAFNSPVRITTEEVGIAANQEACGELISISPTKMDINTDKTVNQQTGEEIIPDINKDLNKTETAEEKDNSHLQKSLHDEKKLLLDDSGVIENPNTVEVSNNEINLEGNADNELQKSLHDEKKPLLDVSDNPKENTIEINHNEINLEENAVSESQKILHDEKKSLLDVTDNPKENTVEVSNKNASLKNGSSDNVVKESLFFDDDDDFLLDSIDLNEIQLMKSDDDNTDEDIVPSPQIPKCPERKSNGVVPKRVSMLKKVAVMNSIAENIETDEHVSVNLAKVKKNNQSSRNTPRHSKRISGHSSVDALCESPLKNSMDSPKVTPRRSSRLIKLSSTDSESTVSPFQEKNARNIKVRRSVRLIDFDTPEKAACEKVIGENLENLDPNNFLIDFESPTMPALPKSKKVSLLYSPERRKSIRKSIRGDLMSFSPV